MARKPDTEEQKLKRQKLKRGKRARKKRHLNDPNHVWVSHQRHKPFSFVAVGMPKDYRNALNLTQEAMARTLGMSLRKWQMAEAGDLTLNNAELLGLRFLVASKYSLMLEKRMYKAVNYMLTVQKPILTEHRQIKKEANAFLVFGGAKPRLNAMDAENPEA